MKARDKISGTILIADGNQQSRQTSADILRNNGFKVEMANSGQDVLYKFVLFHPDLVLLDANLPGMDGFRICEILRRDPNGKDVPIILVLKSQEAREVSHGYRVGATDFITRPVNWLMMAQRISYVLRAGMAMRQLKQSESGLEFAQRLARMGSWSWEAREIRWSAGLTRLLGLDTSQTPGFDSMLAMVHPDDRAEVSSLIQNAFQAGKGFGYDHRFILANGEEMHVHQEVEVKLDSRGAPVQIRGVIQDITRRVQSEQKIRRLAYYNMLTGLPNRQSFQESLKLYLDLAQRDNNSGAVFFIDVDSLKRINDTFGHQFGDQLILSVGKRLEAMAEGFRMATNPNLQVTILAHSGGGLFLVLIYPFVSEAACRDLAESICSELSRPYELEERELYVTASAGCIFFPEHGADMGTILKNGERAMFHAKREGRSNYQIYNPALRGGSAEILSLESDLRRAVERSQLQVYYQPKLHIPTKDIRSVEALVRWQHPEKGLISPGQFIPLAEENGLILSIGAWVLNRACFEIKQLSARGFPGLAVAVNLSARQFLQQPIVELVRFALEDTGLEPTCLEVEITESVIMKDAEESIDILKQLKEMGVKIAVDDFGTGYSSLSYLKRFPIDILKIDGAFIRNIQSDGENQAIASAILALSHRLGQDSVAECVETQEQLDMLAEMACDYAQGFLIGRPMPLDALEELLKGRKTTQEVDL
ncbi:MAG: EAL domain-containing protein [Acidobacteriota bacterium]|nr:EAL domain-containing protein [Acidobacteriota bacterium]